MAEPELPEGQDSPQYSAALEKLEERLRCSICREQFKSPRTLSCMHTFCKDCLEQQQTIEQAKTGKEILQCKTCRFQAALPDNGVKGLSVDSNLADLVNLRDKLELITGLRQQSVCTKHQKPLDVYCESCKELACMKCTLSAHNAHVCSMVEDIFEDHKSVLESSLVPLKTKVGEYESAIADFEAQSQRVSEQGDAVKKEVRSTIQQLITSLQSVEKQISEATDAAVQQKLLLLSWQRGEVESVLVHMRTCMEFVQEEIANSSQQQMVTMQNELITEIASSLTIAGKKETAPIEEANLSFKKDEAALTATTNVGKLEYSYNYLSQRCTATGKALSSSMVAFQTSFFLTFKTEHGVPLSFSPDLIQCQLSYHYFNYIKKCPCHVTSDGPGVYKVTYTPISRGLHQVKILVGNVPIPNSPFKVNVFPYPDMRKKAINVFGGLTGPFSTCLMKNGSIVVTEWNKHCVSVMSSKGDIFAIYGKKGNANLQFNCPSGLAITHDNYILVADTYNHRIQKLTAKGDFVSAIGSHGNGRLRFNRPSWIAIHPITQDIFVSDTINHRVQVLKPNLTYQRCFGEQGNEPGKFQQPGGIAFDAKGMVYVVDSGNHRIQIFTAKGHLRAEFAQPYLKLPSGICIDNCGVVYVSDVQGHTIVSFTSDGSYLGTFGNVDQPHGIIVDETGNLYVTDGKQGCIIVC